MKKRLMAFMALTAALTAVAAPLTPEEALGRLDTTGRKNARGNTPQPRLISSRLSGDGAPALYIFTYNGDDGFMILPADDVAAPLLGYSERGTLPDEDLSPSFESWLSLYAEQIAAAAGEGIAHAPSVQADDSREAIPPMIATRWDQGYPYNFLCPKINGFSTMTGCVATSMAQVMRYWQYPASGIGSVSYICTGVEDPLTMDFSEIQFDWDNMLDEYKGNYGSAPRYAVATLMQACGYSVRMEYGRSASSTGSGEAATALRNYFGYDKEISVRDRSRYSQEGWNAMVYQELAANGPVIYNGISPAGGHSFLCDGYDGNGLFHINWGWSGLADGYFLLDALNPSSVGAGGSMGGYNAYQTVIAGISPPAGRLTLVGDITVENHSPESGNVKGWGYTNRLDSRSNIILAFRVRVSGGVVSSPIYVTVYETNPTTLTNEVKVYDAPCEELLQASEGLKDCRASFSLTDFDPSKLYTAVVAYNVKGQRTILGTLRMAASSGVDEIGAENPDMELRQEGDMLLACGEGDLVVYDMQGRPVIKVAGSNPVIDTASLPRGVYIARALSARTGMCRSLRLLLK